MLDQQVDGIRQAGNSNKRALVLVGTVPEDCPRAPVQRVQGGREDLGALYHYPVGDADRGQARSPHRTARVRIFPL